MNRSLRLVGIFALTAAPFAPALAGSQNAAFTVQVNVVSACSISAATLDFGSYTPTALVGASGSSALTVNCTNGAIATIDLDQGAQPATGSTALVPLRQMAHIAGRLAYLLYQDTTHLVPWGAGLASKSFTGTGVASTVTVYGFIAPLQTVTAATYTDSVTATINY